jgi:hypothetical protein
MITEDEEFKFNDKCIDYEQSIPPKWQEIEDLLNFAEELKKKCDIMSIGIYFLNTIFAFLSMSFLIVGGDFCLKHFNDITFVPAAYFLLLFYISLMAYVTFRDKMERGKRSELRALNSVIGFLRENHALLTRDFSDLQKIHLKIKLSRFDI